VKAIVLAAGYATRLYPLTLDKPKPLLEVGGRSILDRLLAQLASLEGLDHVYVVTNSKFAHDFRAFGRDLGPQPFELTVVDDGTTSDETKLGAIGDLELVVRQEGIDDDLLVAAGDSIFDEPRLGELVALGRDRGAPVIAVREVDDPEQLRSYSVLATDDEGRIVSFQEKPEEPRGTLAGIALYFYPRSALPLIRRYIEEGNNPDQPGRLVEWLHTRVPFYTSRLGGRWYDIGSMETLAAADREFAQS
jgi:glucose-1-phosphate thymidylyltransferase